MMMIICYFNQRGGILNIYGDKKKSTSLFSSMSPYRTAAYYADCFQVPRIISKLF